MSTLSHEVQSLLRCLGSLFNLQSTTGILLTPQVCANVLYGLQNCSCTDDNARNIIYMVLGRVKQLLAPTSVNKLPGDGLNATDLLCLYQGLSLSLLMMPDLALDDDLRSDLHSQQGLLAHTVECRTNAGDLRRNNSMLVEVRLSEALTDILAGEPFNVSCGELLFGFETASVVRLQSVLPPLQTVNGAGWSPVLNIEVEGTSLRFPAKALFMRLRNRFLQERKGIYVESVPAATLNSAPGFQRNILRARPDLLDVLYPPSLEDAAKFASILVARNLTGAGGLMSTVHNDDPKSLAGGNGLMNHQHHDGSSFFSSSDDTLTHSRSSVVSRAIGSKELYCDDNQEHSLGHDPHLPLAPKGLKVNRGMCIGWIGDRCAVVVPSQNQHPHVSRAGSKNNSPVGSIGGRLKRNSPTTSMIPDPSNMSYVSPPLPVAMSAVASVPQSRAPPSLNFRAQGQSQSGSSYSDYSQSPSHYQQHSSGASDDASGEPEDDIALLEAELEIKRMEAKLLAMRKARPAPKAKAAEDLSSPEDDGCNDA